MAEGKSDEDALIKQVIEFEATRKYDTVELYGSWKGLNPEEHDPVGEMIWQGDNLYSLEVLVPVGTHNYRFLVDEEDWETNDFTRKTAILGDEYNVLEVGEPGDSEGSPTSGEEGDEGDGPAHVVYDEAAGGFIVSKKRIGRGSVDVLPIPDKLVGDAKAAVSASREGSETTRVVVTKPSRRRRRVKPFATRGGGRDVDLEAEMKKREEEMGRMVYVQTLRLKQAHQEELNEIKELWKQERTVRMQMFTKLKTDFKAAKKAKGDLEAEIEKMQKLAVVSSEGDKKMNSTLEESLKSKNAELEKARADLSAAREELKSTRESHLSKEEENRGQVSTLESEKKSLQSEIDSLKSQVSAMEKQNSLLVSNMETMKSGSAMTMEQQTARLASLKASASEDKEELIRVKEELKQMKEEVSQRESELKAMKEELSQKENDLKTEQTKCTGLSERVSSMEGELTALSATGKASDEAKKAIESAKTALLAEKKALEDKIATLESRIAEQKAAFEADLKSAKQQASDDIAAVTAKSGAEQTERLEAVRKEMEKRDEELRLLKEELTAMKDSLADNEAKLAAANTRGDVLEKDLAEVKAARDALDQQAAELKAKVASLEGELAETKASAEAAAATASDKIAALDSEIEGLKSSSSAAASESEGKITKLEESISKLKDEMDEANAAKAELADELTQTKQSLESVKSEKATLDERVASLEAKLQSERDESEKALAAKEARITEVSRELGESLSKKEEELAKVSGELADTQGKLDEKCKEFVSAETTIAGLKTELDASVANLARQKEDFETQMSDLVTRNKKVGESAKSLAKKMVNIREDMKAVRSEKIDEMEKMNEFFPSFQGMMTKAFDVSQGMIDDLMEKYKRELTLRRKYFNMLQDLRGNIRVFCRIRPLLGRELERGYGTCVTFPQEGMLKIKEESGNEHTFEFDRIYDPSCGQAQVSEDTTEYVQSVMDGYNVSIFAYGQTGSGKTYTMNGPEDNPGVNMRALKFLFKLAKDREPMFEYKIRVSMLEVYNEKIRDLLRNISVEDALSAGSGAASASGGRKKKKKKGSASPAAPAKKAGPLEYKIQHLPDGSVEVTNLVWVPVTSEADISRLQREADKTRSMTATDMNLHSSRSHMIVIVDVDGFNHPANIQYLGKLYLVDLAGSEKIKKSKVEGAALKEALNINASLTALGNVMEALQKSKGHIPYRDSILTHLMSNSLGGNAKTVMFINACPTAEHATETVSSLRFAEKVARVQLGQAKAKTSKKVKKKKAAAS